MTTGIVCLSSGLDCVTSLAIALDTGVDVKQAIFFDYGQKACLKEFKQATEVAKYYNIPLTRIELPWLKEITKTSLVNEEALVPTPDSEKLDVIFDMHQTAAAVWVPNRNGVMTNILAAFCDSFGYDEIIVGFNGEEAVTFADNTFQCAAALTESFSYTTRQQPVVKSYVQSLNKMEISLTSVKLQVPLDLVWSCYHSGDYMCGECESCKRFIRAFKSTNNWSLVAHKFNLQEQPV